MAVQTSLRVVARRIGDAIRSFAAGEGLTPDEFAIAGSFDEPTERFYLVVGSVRPIDEHRWHAGIRTEIRKDFEDFPGITSRLVLVVRNVAKVDQIYSKLDSGDDLIDVTDMF